MRILLSVIVFFLFLDYSFADFNNGDVFSKGIVIQNNGTTITGGGRTINFTGSCVTVSTSGGVTTVDITCSGGGATYNRIVVGGDTRITVGGDTRISY